MKNTKTCPKCGSRDLAHVPGEIGAHGVGNNIRTGFTIFSMVKVTRFVCLYCGFSEEWIESREDLDKIREKFKG